MSFSSRAKAELCQARPDRKCCAVAESYGVLLYCNTFSANEIRVITASPEFASRLPKLFRKAFGVSFDRLPPEGAEGKRTLSITDADKLSAIFDAFGADRGATLSHHINFGVIEEDCCRASFIRGAFLAGGSVTDPEKRYHLELATSHRSVSREADKTVAAAQEQMNAIRRIAKDYGLDALPEPLKDAALLRIANPEASLADLATLSYPPVTKSCLNHRFKKIMGFKPEEE